MYLNHLSRESFIAQLAQAFTQQPNKAGTLIGVRKIHQGMRGKRTALFPSRKGGGSIAIESRLELAHALQLERNPEVSEYRSQAVQVPVASFGEAGNSFIFPDFVVRTCDGSFEVHEVKAQKEHLSDEIKQRLLHLQTALANIGILYKIYDCNDLPSQRETDRMLLLYTRGHYREYTEGEVSFALEILNNPVANRGEAEQLLKEVGLPDSLLDYLIFHRFISFPESLASQSMGGAE